MYICINDGDAMDKERATIVIEKSVWKDFKKMAIDKEMPVSRLLEMVIVEYMNNGKDKA